MREVGGFRVVVQQQWKIARPDLYMWMIYCVTNSWDAVAKWCRIGMKFCPFSFSEDLGHGCGMRRPRRRCSEKKLAVVVSHAGIMLLCVCAMCHASALLGWAAWFSVRLPRPHIYNQDTICRCAQSHQGACLGLLRVSQPARSRNQYFNCSAWISSLLCMCYFYLDIC